MLDSIERYNIELDFWRKLDDVRTPERISKLICYSVDDRFIVLFGGCTESAVAGDSCDTTSNSTIHLMKVEQKQIEEHNDLINNEKRLAHQWLSSAEEASEEGVDQPAREHHLPPYLKICASTHNEQGLITTLIQKDK